MTYRLLLLRQLRVLAPLEELPRPRGYLSLLLCSPPSISLGGVRQILNLTFDKGTAHVVADSVEGE